MTNSSRTSTRVHEHAVERPRLVRDSDALARVCERGVYPGCQVTPLRLGDVTIVLSPPAGPSRIVSAVGYRYRDPIPPCALNVPTRENGPSDFSAIPESSREILIDARYLDRSGDVATAIRGSDRARYQRPLILSKSMSRQKGGEHSRNNRGSFK